MSPQPLIVLRPHHPAWAENGEGTIARLLEQRGISYDYERLLYPLRVGEDGRLRAGFCPDFHLPATAERPAINIEVTFADRGLPELQRERYRANLARLDRKRWKIRQTSCLFQIETVLITRRVYQLILRDPGLLDRLIKQAAARHRRQERRSLATAA